MKMRKFIFTIMTVAFIGMFASCDSKSTTGNAENDSTAVDTTNVDTTVVDSIAADSTVILK